MYLSLFSLLAHQTIEVFGDYYNFGKAHGCAHTATITNSSLLHGKPTGGLCIVNQF